MLKVSENLLTTYGSFLYKRNIPIPAHNYYKKWLRYYLDYCNKYRFHSLNSDSLPHFLDKLKEKKQTGIQQKQAHESIHLFYELARQQVEIKKTFSSANQNQGIKDIGSHIKPEKHETDSFHNQNICKYNKKPVISKGVTNCSWQQVFLDLNNEIKVRHYSPKTLKSYMIWVRKFQYFTKSKNPEALSSSDVKEFLTFLAVEKKVSASNGNGVTHLRARQVKKHLSIKKNNTLFLL